jgi:hypothetical protein
VADLHLHTQIAQAARDALASSAVASLAGRAFAYQVYPTDRAELPYGCAWVPREETQRESGDGDVLSLVESIVELRVALFVTGEEGEIEDLLEASMLEVQQVLADGLEIASGEVDLDFQGCDKSYERGDLPYGQAVLRFDAEVAYLKGNPAELAWR